MWLRHQYQVLDYIRRDHKMYCFSVFKKVFSGKDMVNMPFVLHLFYIYIQMQIYMVYTFTCLISTILAGSISYYVNFCFDLSQQMEAPWGSIPYVYSI